MIGVATSKSKLEQLSYFKQALSNIIHTKQILFDAGLLDGDLRLQFLSMEKFFIQKIEYLETDISYGIIF